MPIASLERIISKDVDRRVDELWRKTYIALSKNNRTPPIKKNPPIHPSVLTCAPKRIA